MSEGSKGNGTDLGHIVSMLGDVLTAQEMMRVEMSEFRVEFNGFRAETRRDIGELKRDMVGVKRDIAGVKHDVASLRQTVAQYHASVLGHGILISELDERLRRVEEHLSLPPAA